MDLLTLIVTLGVVGFVLWLITTYVPMPPAYRSALIVVVLLLIVLWLVRILNLAVLSPRL